MAVARYEKTPEGELDYGVEWIDWLETSEVISLISNTNITGNDALLLVDSTEIVDSGKTALIWLHGGTVGETYTIEVEITTDNVPARISRRSFLVTILEDRFLEDS